jgi:hypothetical protein
MSGRIALHVALVASALTCTGCSDDQATPLAPVAPASASALTADRAGGRYLRDASTGVLNEFRIAETPVGTSVTWTVEGRPFVTLDYGPLTSAELSNAGRFALHTRYGERVATYDDATRRLSLPGSRVPIGGLSATDVDFDAAQECTLALAGLNGTVSMLVWAISASKDKVPQAISGVFAAWMFVEASCSWLLRLWAYEFMNPIVQIEWK